MKNKFISVLLSFLLAASMVMPVQAAGSFRDVPRNHWAYASIEKMERAGIVSGVGQGKFDPDGYVTTAQFISMLMRLFFGPEMAADTEAYSIWYGKALQLAAENGLLYQLEIAKTNRRASGAEKWNKTEANSPMLREETAVLLYNFLKQTVALPSENTLRTVTAEKIPDLHKNTSILEQFAIASVYEMGCLSGTDKKGSFSGMSGMTRAQACVALDRVEKLVRAADGKTVGADWVKKAEIGGIKEALAIPRLTNGEKITEKSVLDAISALQQKYPHGMECSDEGFHYIDPGTGTVTGNSGCYAFAMYVYDAVFGYGSFHQCKTVTLQEGNFSSIKAGDHIRIHDRPHSVVVLEKGDDYVKVVEGNFNGKVSWGRVYAKADLLGYQKVTVSSVY